MGMESVVIVLTAYNWDDIEAEAREAGVDSFLTKPLFSNQVMKAYKTALAGKMLLQNEKTLSRLKGRRILLAEDMAINAEIMKQLLKTHGHRRRSYTLPALFLPRSFPHRRLCR